MLSLTNLHLRQLVETESGQFHLSHLMSQITLFEKKALSVVYSGVGTITHVIALGKGNSGAL